MYTLRITPAIANEWAVRCIGDVIPALADRMFEPGQKIVVDRATLNEIVADCRFMIDPNGPDTTPGERRAYRAFLTQCERALTIGPIEQSLS